LLGSQSGEESTNQGDLEVGTAAASRTRPAADTEWSGIQTDRVNVNGFDVQIVQHAYVNTPTNIDHRKSLEIIGQLGSKFLVVEWSVVSYG